MTTTTDLTTRLATMVFKRPWGRFVDYTRTSDEAPWMFVLVMGTGFLIALTGWGVFMILVVNE